MSDRLRLDLVLNDFAACACRAREITVLSDGLAVAPLIDVKDMAARHRVCGHAGPPSRRALLMVNEFRAGADSGTNQVKDPRPMRSQTLCPALIEHQSVGDRRQALLPG